jgi:leucyl aminopeptidase
MKTKERNKLENFFRNGFDTCFETTAKSIVPIKFEGLEISSKVF